MFSASLLDVMQEYVIRCLGLIICHYKCTHLLEVQYGMLRLGVKPWHKQLNLPYDKVSQFYLGVLFLDGCYIWF